MIMGRYLAMFAEKNECKITPPRPLSKTIAEMPGFLLYNEFCLKFYGRRFVFQEKNFRDSLCRMRSTRLENALALNLSGYNLESFGVFKKQTGFEGKLNPFVLETAFKSSRFYYTFVVQRVRFLVAFQQKLNRDRNYFTKNDYSEYNSP